MRASPDTSSNFDWLTGNLTGKGQAQCNENAKFKRIVADVMLDNVVLKDLLGKS